MKKFNVGVSIIIPSYNSSDTIERAINSVINQSYDDWEIIIIDEYESNTDFSFLYDLKYQKYNYKIKVYKNSKKLGSLKSRNKGIKLSKAKYISFLDTDDEFLENKLNTQIEFLETNKDFIGCGCQMQVHNNGEKVYTTDWQSLDEDECYAYLIFSSVSWTSSIVFNREKFIKYNLFAIYNVCEDYQMICKSISYGRFKNVGGTMVNYYYNGNNLSLNPEVINNEKKYRVEITQNYLKKLKLHISDRNVYKYLLCNFNKYNQKKEKFDIIKCKLLFIYIYLFARNLNKKSLKKVLKEKYYENYKYYSK